MTAERVRLSLAARMRSVAGYVAGIINRRRMDARLDEEIALHLEMESERNMRHGRVRPRRGERQQFSSVGASGGERRRATNTAAGYRFIHGAAGVLSCVFGVYLGVEILLN